MARVAMSTEDVDLHYNRFADWLCELHGIGKAEGKQVWTKLAEEIRAWFDAEHPPGVMFDAFQQAIRVRMKRDNPRILIIESRRGGATSLYEIRGRKFGQAVEEPKPLELVPDEETFDGGPAEGELQRAQQFEQIEQPAEAEPHPLFASEAAIGPQRQADHEAVEKPVPLPTGGDLLMQITSLVERAGRADEAETKTELALEMLQDAAGQLSAMCELCTKMQSQITRALDELR